MPDIEDYEDELWDVIFRMRQDKIDPETIFYILNEMKKSLELMVYCERWFKDAR